MEEFSDIFHKESSNLSPEDIAQILFKEDPKPPCSCQIIAQDETAGQDLSVTFEIILTVFMEGLMILYNNLDGIDMANFTEDHLTALNPWLQSVGFTLSVNTFDKQDELYTDDWNDYYNKIIIKNSSYKQFFIIKEFTKSYCFMLNQKYYHNPIDKNMITDIYAVFMNTNKVYKIKFDFFIGS
jgi:hypothetical protein